MILPENQGSWEWMQGYVTEGPYMLKHNGKYYLTYTANGYETQYYAVGFATSNSPLGTYKKYENNPILSKLPANDVYGPGHHCFTTSPDKNELIIVYHKHQSSTKVDSRMVCIDRAYFDYDSSLGYDILRVAGPTGTAQPLPNGAQ